MLIPKIGVSPCEDDAWRDFERELDKLEKMYWGLE